MNLKLHPLCVAHKYQYIATAQQGQREIKLVEKIHSCSTFSPQKTLLPLLLLPGIYPCTVALIQQQKKNIRGSSVSNITSSNKGLQDQHQEEEDSIFPYPFYRSRKEGRKGNFYTAKKGGEGMEGKTNQQEPPFPPFLPPS